MGALETSLDAHEIRARRGFDFGGKVATGNQVAMHQGGSGARDQPIFLVGQRTPSEVGALTGEDTHTPYHRVELYMMLNSDSIGRGIERLQRRSFRAIHQAKKIEAVGSAAAEQKYWLAFASSFEGEGGESHSRGCRRLGQCRC